MPYTLISVVSGNCSCKANIIKMYMKCFFVVLVLFQQKRLFCFFFELDLTMGNNIIAAYEAETYVPIVFVLKTRRLVLQFRVYKTFLSLSVIRRGLFFFFFFSMYLIIHRCTICVHSRALACMDIASQRVLWRGWYISLQTFGNYFSTWYYNVSHHG